MITRLLVCAAVIYCASAATTATEGPATDAATGTPQAQTQGTEAGTTSKVEGTSGSGQTLAPVTEGPGTEQQETGTGMTEGPGMNATSAPSQGAQTTNVPPESAAVPIKSGLVFMLVAAGVLWVLA